MVVKHTTTTIKKKKVIKSKPVVNTAKKVVKPVKEKKDDGPALDEKGNPLPIENSEGGDPVCVAGYGIDYDFDILDPINPPFRCISVLKDPSDSPVSKVMNKLNNPSSNASGLVSSIPAAGGSRRKRKTFIRAGRSVRRNRRLTRHKKL